MYRTSPSNCRVRQRGAALLIFILLGAIAVLSLMLNRLTSHSGSSGSEATVEALAMAKDAIIGWSASHATTPGMLPCPEDTSLIGTGSEGQAQSGCSNTLPSVGRLPWRTLKLPQLRDDAGELLWYAISPGFRLPSKINSNSVAQLTVDGTPNVAVAIVFSPGPPLSGQNRPVPTPPLPPAVAQYLEGFNIGAGSFVSTGAPGLFNDRLLAVTRDDLFRSVNRRIMAETRGDTLGGLQEYYLHNSNNYPLASASLQAELSTNAIMDNNLWYPLVTYNVNTTRQQVTLSINVPKPVSCTITASQMLCPNP